MLSCNVRALQQDNKQMSGRQNEDINLYAWRAANFYAQVCRTIKTLVLEEK